MKDSGLFWAKEIPKAWSINKVKYLFRSGKGLSITKDNLTESGLPVVSYGQIHAKTNSGTDTADELLRFVDTSYEKSFPQCKVNQFDFVFADTSEDYDGIGNCVYKRSDNLLYAGYHSIILKSKNKKDNRFLAYLFKTDAWRSQLRKSAFGVKVFSISQKLLLNASVILPPQKEQEKIADFLDSKCSSIDSISSSLKEQIEVLEKYKKSLIFEAVTKGLDKDAPMKDSGIEWVGKMPEGWELSRLQFMMKQIKAKNTPVRTNQVLSLMKDVGVIPYEEKGNVGNKSKEDVSEYNLAFPNTLVMNCMNVLIGSVGISKYYGCVSPVYYVFKETEGNDLRFINYIFSTREFQKELRKYANGILEIRMRVSANDILKRKIPLPPQNVQAKIADYLDSKCSAIDSAIAGKKEQISILAEYKKSLIYEYVTGKKEIPNS